MSFKFQLWGTTIDFEEKYLSDISYSMWFTLRLIRIKYAALGYAKGSCSEVIAMHRMQQIADVLQIHRIGDAGLCFDARLFRNRQNHYRY